MGESELSRCLDSENNFKLNHLERGVNMTKLKKQRKKKTYNYGRNRKRVRKQQERTTKFNVKVDNKVMKDAWDNRISVKENMTQMGIVLSANDVVPVVGTKKKMINKLKSLKNLPIGEESPLEVVKPDVLSKLTEEANAHTHMMDKHGTDYKAMSRDPKNLYQETPAKLRGMIRKFISIPEHYAPYCKERGLLDTSSDVINTNVDIDSD